MKHKMYAIFDVKAEAYLPPWFLPTDGMALRAFADCVNDGDHNFGRHPNDYSLFCIGSFEDSDAEILSCKRSMGNGVEFIRAHSEPDMFISSDTLEEVTKRVNAEDRDG